MQRRCGELPPTLGLWALGAVKSCLKTKLGEKSLQKRGSLIWSCTEEAYMCRQKRVGTDKWEYGAGTLVVSQQQG